MTERTSTPASTATRRQFLACGLAAPVAYAGLRAGQPNDSDTSAESFERHSDTSTDCLSPAASGRARVAIISGIGDWWRPRNWRSVPDHGAIIELSDPVSFREARQRVKSFNRYPQLSPGMWAIVVATDARRERKAGDRKSGETGRLVCQMAVLSTKGGAV